MTATTINQDPRIEQPPTSAASVTKAHLVLGLDYGVYLV